MNKTYDYTKRYIGHDFIFHPQDAGLKGHMYGWGLGLVNSDYLILPNGIDNTRYQIKSISYFLDPSDMWTADVIFAPRCI